MVGFANSKDSLLVNIILMLSINGRQSFSVSFDESSFCAMASAIAGFLFRVGTALISSGIFDQSRSLDLSMISLHWILTCLA